MLVMYCFLLVHGVNYFTNELTDLDMSIEIWGEMLLNIVEYVTNKCFQQNTMFRCVYVSFVAWWFTFYRVSKNVLYRVSEKY